MRVCSAVISFIRLLRQQCYSLTSCNRLWHQLTVELEKVIKHPCFKQAGNTDLLSLYQHFIRDFQTKLNELKLASLALTISLQYSGNTKARLLFQCCVCVCVVVVLCVCVCVCVVGRGVLFCFVV